MSRVLILGGTSEAASLARAVAASGWAAPILSLAGLTEAAQVEGVVMRSGGFGGPEGLTRYLRGTGIAAVFDATHPFAARISGNAAAACAAAGVPLLRLAARAQEHARPPGGHRGGRIVVVDPRPVAGAGPARPRQTQQRHPGRRAGGRGVTADPRGERVRGVDHPADTVAAQILPQSVDAAETADPHVADRQCRVAHPAGQRRGHRDPGTVQFSGQRPCLGGPAEDQHGIHPVTVAAVSYTHLTLPTTECV